jgi:hypothetical protein
MMSRLKTALVIGAALLVVGASGAQAAKLHFPLWNVGLIGGLGTPSTLVLDPDRRISAIDLSGDPDGDGKKAPITPGVKPSGNDWKTQYIDNPDGGEWQQSTASQDAPQWTMQTATRDDP